MPPDWLGVPEGMIPEGGAMGQKARRLADRNAKGVDKTRKYVPMRKPDEEDGYKAFVGHRSSP